MPIVPVTIDLLNEPLLFTDNEPGVLREIFDEQVYLLPAQLLEGVREQPLVRIVDIGAHCGGASLYLATAFRLAGHEGDIYARCFEPQPLLAETCEKNLRVHGVECFVRPVAVTGKAKCYYDVLGHKWPCMSTVMHSSSDRAPYSASSEETLLGLDGEIDVLKIDTEGWEVEILYGMMDHLHRFRCILVEHHNEYARRMIDALLVDFHRYHNSQQSQCVGVSNYLRRDWL
jgi:FkbM family methyltransferase